MNGNTKKTEQMNTKVDLVTRQRIDAIAAAHPITPSTLAYEAIKLGLPELEKRYPPVKPQEVNAEDTTAGLKQEKRKTKAA